jgi:hypothetical protein
MWGQVARWSFVYGRQLVLLLGADALVDSVSGEGGQNSAPAPVPTSAKLLTGGLLVVTIGLTYKLLKK